MNKCILLGIDAPLSPAVRQAIRTIKHFVGPQNPHVRLILLHVIPNSYLASPSLGMYAAQLQPTSITLEQRLVAEKTLARVRGLIQELDLDEPRIDICIRQGSPADEIIKLATEVHADLIVVGSRGSAFKERLRRFFLGSKSRRVLQHSPCPVMIVTQPFLKSVAELANWYTEAITRYLQKHPEHLTVLTPEEVIQLFALPAGIRGSERKELQGAQIALEKLASDGVLCRHEVQGEMRYVND